MVVFIIVLICYHWLSWDGVLNLKEKIYKVNRNRHLRHATLPPSRPEMRAWLCMYMIILLDLMKLTAICEFSVMYVL